MITIYQMFKIIFGLVASGFILYFLISYTGSYASTQEDVMRVLIIHNFRGAVQDVYFTGNPTNFSDFGRLNFTLYFDGTAEPPVLKSEVGETVFLTPVFFSPSDELFIDRGRLDYGWFRFYFAEALPEMQIIFNPLDADTQKDWELMRNITALFPSTTGWTPKVKFGFCGYPDGSSISDLRERYDFLDSPSNVLRNPPASPIFRPCSASMALGQRLVTISQSCSPGSAGQGICIQPPGINGIGFAYINGSDKSYLYKDALDLAAMIIGGEGMDIYKIRTLGESYYEYKNKIWRDHVRLAAVEAAQRAQLMEARLPASIQELNECKSLYSSLKNILYFGPNSVHNLLSQQDYHTNQNTVSMLLGKLGEAGSVYQEMVSRGCEYAI